MEFNLIIKQVLFPELAKLGFVLIYEYKGKLLFHNDYTRFFISISYDYAFSKDFSFTICYETTSNDKYCIDDYELVEVLGYNTNHYQNLSEHEQISKFAQYYKQLVINYSDEILHESSFMNFWQRTKNKTIL